MRVKATFENFLKRSNDIHNHKYNYDKVNFISNQKLVIIICPIHGEFLQKPSSHITGRGCMKCGHLKTSASHKINKEYFVGKAKSIHGEKYDYSNIIYKGDKIKCAINCLKHGIFYQSPNSHYVSGCPDCAKEFNSLNAYSNTENFIKKAFIVHKNFYTYERTNYIGAHKKIIVNCPIHGYFECTPNNHLNGVGCKTCGLIMSQFAYTKRSSNTANKIPHGFYIIECMDGKETFYKVGVSKDVNKRLKDYLKYYKNSNVCYYIKNNLEFCVNLEQFILKQYKEYKYKPLKKFAGFTECLSINPINYFTKLNK